MAQSTLNLIYVYDALCGWCYGFTPTFKAFLRNHPQEFQVDVISGGMVTGNRVGPIGEVASYISKAYQDVEEATGVKFGHGFLDHTLKEGKAIFNSTPPALALSVFKKHKAIEDVDYAHRIQEAIYKDGMEPEDYEGYARIAETYGLDREDFLKDMKSPAHKTKVEKEFELAKTWGIQGFPTVVLIREGTGFVLARGFVKEETLEQAYSMALKQEV